LIKAIHEIRSVDDILNIDVDDIMVRINKSSNIKQLIDLSDIVYKSLEDLYRSLNDQEGRYVSKSTYKVCILEDDPKFLTLVSSTLSNVFNYVYPSENEIKSYNLDKLYHELDSYVRDFDIFFVDLLFLKDEKWMPFNGLDIFNLIKSKYPYAVVRLITNLPRDIISKLSENLYADKIIANRILLNHIFTKSKGDKNLKFSLIDRSDEIISEAAENERQKLINESVYPSKPAGIFNINGVKNAIIELINNDPDNFKKILSKAFLIYDYYLKSELEKNTPEWNKGELPSSNTFSKGNWKLSKLLSHLSNIYAHRLLVLHNINPNTHALNMSVYEEEIIEFVGFENFGPTNYLSTRLGLGKEKLKRGNKTIDGYFTIKKDSLFPHELEFLDSGSTFLYDQTIKSIDDNLYKWFMDVLISDEGDLAIAAIMRNEPSFCSPYSESNEILTYSDIRQNILTANYLLEFVSHIKKYNTIESVKKCIKLMYESYDMLPDLKKIPKEIKQKLESLFI
jgi:hypothetical protein